MESSNSAQEWNANVAKVKAAFEGDYPEFWYTAILQSGVAKKTAAKYGQTTDIKMVSYTSRPLALYGRPTRMPPLGEGEKVLGIYDQGLGEKTAICNTVEDMQRLYDSYASGMALRLKWAVVVRSETTLSGS